MITQKDIKLQQEIATKLQQEFAKAIDNKNKELINKTGTAMIGSSMILSAYLDDYPTFVEHLGESLIELFNEMPELRKLL